MSGIWTRFNSVMLVLVFMSLVAVIAMLATGVRSGPLDPSNTPAPTDSVRLPGTPISGPTTINAPGHYYLTRNIDAPGPMIAITISSSDVSLDLGGFTIDGTDGGGNWGIYLAGVVSDVTISNGTVRDFQFGIDAGDDERVTIVDVNAVSGVRGFQVGSRSLLRDCTAKGNTETGIYVPGSASEVRQCTSLLNAGDDIALAGTGNLVKRSWVGDEIRDTGAILNTIRDNTVGSIILTTNGGAYVIDNVCTNVISNPTGNSLAGNQFC